MNTHPSQATLADTLTIGAYSHTPIRSLTSASGVASASAAVAVAAVGPLEQRPVRGESPRQVSVVEQGGRRADSEGRVRFVSDISLEQLLQHILQGHAAHTDRHRRVMRLCHTLLPRLLTFPARHRPGPAAAPPGSWSWPRRGPGPPSQGGSDPDTHTDTHTHRQTDRDD